MNQNIIDILNLSGTGVISLIGGGGKTSIMYQLAKILSGANKNVLTTTTTKIFTPNQIQSPDLIIADNLNVFKKDANQLLSLHHHFSAGQKIIKSKVIGFDPIFIDELYNTGIFDWIIVEADGSRQKPIKASDEYEPVIPKTTNRLLVVAGLDAVGTPLNKAFIHRPELFSKNTGLALNERVNEEAMAACLAHEIKKAQGLCQSSQTYLILNKADDSQRELMGKKIEEQIIPSVNINRTLLLSCKDDLIVKRIHHGNKPIFKGR